MDISRGFLRTGCVYLVIGILIGMYMGGSGDHSLTPIHAHINLLGAVLMLIFGILYRVLPSLAEDWMGKAHFWLYQIGSLILLIGLYLMVSGKLPEATVGPALLVAEVAVLSGTLIFVGNLWKRTG